MSISFTIYYIILLSIYAHFLFIVDVSIFLNRNIILFICQKFSIYFLEVL